MKAITLNKTSTTILRYMITAFLIFTAGFMLLRFPETAAQGISDGVDLSLGSLIPSLFPFMVLSAFIVESGFFSKVPLFAEILMRRIFSLSGPCFQVLLLSLIGGLPLGCKMTSELYDKGEISLIHARRMLLFCFCTGPAFTVSSVGFYILGSKKAGGLIYLSLLLSSLTVGILSHFFGEDNSEVLPKRKEDYSDNLSVCFVKSVSNGSSAMLKICAWVILFSCLTRLIEIMPVSQSLGFTLCTLLEVTNGTKLAAGSLSLPLIAGIISFGGFCGHCQVMPYILKLKLKYKYFLTARVVNASLTVVYCECLIKLIPISYEVFSMGTLPKESSLTVSAVYSVSMLATAGLFLLGDSAVFKIKTRKDHRN